MRNFLILLVALTFIFSQPFGAAGNNLKWWQKWPRYPKGYRISAKEVMQLQLRGERMMFVYGGYEVDEIVCGSHIIPYNKIPPYGDGSAVGRFPVPKDWWIICYCP
jgi:hypothetical protein